MDEKISQLLFRFDPQQTSLINYHLYMLRVKFTTSSDILTVFGGVSLVVHIKKRDSLSLWMFNNMIWLSFYAGVPLLFGLVLIRVCAI